VFNMAKRATSTAPKTRPAPSAARPAPSPTVNLAPDEDAIRRRAYEIFMARGANGGSPLEDWLQAEREIVTGRRRTKTRAN